MIVFPDFLPSLSLLFDRIFDQVGVAGESICHGKPAIFG